MALNDPSRCIAVSFLEVEAEGFWRIKCGIRMGTCERKGKAEKETRSQMQLRPYKASAYPTASGANMALSHAVLSLFYTPGLSKSPNVAAQEGCDSGVEVFHYWQQVVPEDNTGSRPLCLPHCGVVLLALNLSVPQCVGRTSRGQ